MKLVLIWIQGSWKWTQARLLKEKYWFDIFETWHELRHIGQKDTELWRKVKSIIESWSHVPAEIVGDILQEYTKHSRSERIIFDWLVRNLWNKEVADKSLLDYSVLFFDMSEQESMRRLLWRVYNPKTWETFESWTLVDPKTWEELERRVDDQEEAIKTRIQRFYDNTLPLIDIYKKENRLISVDAEQSVEEVFKEVQQKLWL